MTRFSVADAKNNLPKLIDRALEGEEVIITRHGKPVVELRPAIQPKGDRRAVHEWFMARRRLRPGIPITSVELLNQMYEEKEREDDERLFGHERPSTESD
ncbi:MAG TPA: type II toxin-antitoxin system prevent-host-death family antitoxin [Stellaceae bacterium]|nr:type II toxin-antitoxin system prevent-host-death family antitoxin [Stellaceae bacterium]